MTQLDPYGRSILFFTSRRPAWWSQSADGAQDPVKQEDFAAFAFKVDRLGQSVGLPVAGVFFAKSRYQVGALRSGRHEGVTMAVVSDREIVGEGFVIEYHRWDYMVDKRAKDATIHIGRPV